MQTNEHQATAQARLSMCIVLQRGPNTRFTPAILRSIQSKPTELKMKPKSKRYTRKDVKAGKVALPRRLNFLEMQTYDALICRKSEDKEKWFIEISVAAAKSLLLAKEARDTAEKETRNAKQEAIETMEKVGALQFEIQQLQGRYAALERQFSALEKANDQLRRNTEEDTLQEESKMRSSSFWNKAQAGLINVGRPPLQGGTAGSKKK